MNLKPCPFCGTEAIQKSRPYDNETGHVTKVMCGNPFCNLKCETMECASASNAIETWNERSSLLGAEKL